MVRHAIAALALAGLVTALAAGAAGAQDQELPPDATNEQIAEAVGAEGHPAVERAIEHGGAGTAAGEASANPDILEPQPSLAIWSLVVFLVLLFVLSKLAWKPILDATRRREENLQRALDEAQHARDEAARLLAEHRKQMEQAADQVRGLLDEARRDAQSTSDDILRKAQAEAEASRQRAERDIASARDHALSEIYTRTADLAVAVAGRVLSRELDHGEHRRLVEAAMSELPAGDGQGGAA